MKTDDLISMLAREAQPSARPTYVNRLGVALAAAIALSGLLMLLVLGLRPDLAPAAHLPMFWAKMTFPTVIAVPTIWACWRLAHPGIRTRYASVAIIVATAAMAFLAAVTLVQAAPGARAELIFGNTWKSCLVNIAWLSLPVFGALLWMMRNMAPTRHRLAGAACGLAAGGVAAAVYALHCPELAAPFVALWYTLGMSIPTAAGAALGPRLLRW
jgi:hypothetical protein